MAIYLDIIHFVSYASNMIMTALLILSIILVIEGQRGTMAMADNSISKSILRHGYNVKKFITVSESRYDHNHHTHPHIHQHEIEIPHFEETEGILNSTVYLGKEAKLDCVIHSPGKESVSWMRKYDNTLQILTLNETVYSSDVRYKLEVETEEKWKNWKLKIKNVVESDGGQYRCKLDTSPALVLDIFLFVVLPQVRVVDERKGEDILEKHYNSGSMIELKCIITNIPFPHNSIIWKKGNTRLLFNNSRGGISVRADPKNGIIRSKLYIASASTRDSGIYSCWYYNLKNDTVAVHVIAEHSQGLQVDSHPTSLTEYKSSSSPEKGKINMKIFIISFISYLYLNLLKFDENPPIISL